MLKRILDIVIAVLTLPIIVIVCFIVGVIYFVVERETPIFMQTRVGRNEHEFKMLKLRTMNKNTAELGTHEIDKLSITKVGGFLRNSKLDELPQLWNVLIGQMSLVGPRPGLLSQTQVIVERRKLGVFSVRPGITGQSQLEGIDMSNPKKIAKSDADYIARASFWLDIRILVLTALGAGSGDRIKTMEDI